MNTMIRKVEDRAINGKLSTIMKGPPKCIDRVKIMIDEWLFLPAQQEIYRYSQGVFEVYPSAGDITFFTHYSLRVLAKDAQLVAVTLPDKSKRWKITKRFKRAPS